MKKIFDHLKFSDVLNLINLPVIFICIYLNEYFIILTAVLFISVTGLAFIKNARKEEISFFRHMWSFIASGIGYASDINLLENTVAVTIVSMIVAIILVYFLTRNSQKRIAVLLLYTLCLGSFFYSMTIVSNRTFDRSEAENLTAVVTDKSSLRSGKYLDVYSEETFDGKIFGEAAIRCTKEELAEYNIGDKIDICVKNGAFGIKYYYRTTRR